MKLLARHYAPVIISSDTPTGSAAGGTSIELTGEFFAIGAEVHIGGVLASNIERSSPTTITCDTGPHAVGVVDIVVTNPSGKNSGASGEGLFEYLAVPSEYLWQQDTLTAPWVASDGAIIAYIPATGKLWRFFGWGNFDGPGNPITCTNAVYSAPLEDRGNWSLRLANDADPPTSGAGARARPRHTPSAFFHEVDGILWLYFAGGDHLDAVYFGGGTSQGYASDMWRTADGLTHERVLESDDAPFAGRMLFAAGSHNGLIWVTGGVSGLIVGPTTAFNDLFSSPEGFVGTWTTVLANAPASATRWSARGMVNKLVSFKGRLVMSCGGTYDDDPALRLYFDEIWSTINGVGGWDQHASFGGKARQYLTTEEHDGRLFIGPGFADHGAGVYGNIGDTWSTEDLDDPWFNHGVGPFFSSHADGLCTTPDGLVYMAGNGSISSGGVCSVYTLRPVAKPVTPDRTGMVIWCEAEWADVDTATNVVNQVADRSDFSRHINEYSYASRPRYFSVDPYNGGHPSWGTSDSANEAKLLWSKTDVGGANGAEPYSVAGPHTFFHVITLLSSGSGNTYFRLSTGLSTIGAPAMFGSTAGGQLNCWDASYIGSIPITFDVSHVVCVVYDAGGNSKGFLNDMVTPVFSGTAAAGTAWAGLIIGCAPSEPTRHRMSAIVGFAGITMSQALRVAWGAYLGKYKA